MDGIDTPNSRCDRIVGESPAAWKSYSGHPDFCPAGSGAGPLMLPCAVTLDATVVPTIGRPRGGGGSTL